jgi:hypothetical protein
LVVALPRARAPTGAAGRPPDALPAAHLRPGLGVAHKGRRYRRFGSPRPLGQPARGRCANAWQTVACPAAHASITLVRKCCSQNTLQDAPSFKQFPQDTMLPTSL